VGGGLEIDFEVRRASSYEIDATMGATGTGGFLGATANANATTFGFGPDSDTESARLSLSFGVTP
jgi:hypothetical protein